jgi:glycosyltransferase involved in cell wall biosynthesis
MMVEAAAAPTVSVVIPVYNGERYLERTLESLQAQSFRRFEVVLIDDASTDGGPALIAARAAADPRLRTRRLERNTGCVSRNIAEAMPGLRGEFFVYASQDDLFSEDWLSSLVAAARRTGADAVLPDVVFFRDDRPAGRGLVGLHGDRSVVLTGREAFAYSLDWTVPGNALWRMALVRDVGFDRFGPFSDEYAVRRWFLRCRVVAFCDGIFYYRQDNPEAITKKASPQLLVVPDNELALWRLARDNDCDDIVVQRQALRVLRAVVQARMLALRTPALRAHASVVDACFDRLRDGEFSACLDAALHRAHGPFRRALWRAIHRSSRVMRLFVRWSNFRKALGRRLRAAR